MKSSALNFRWPFTNYHESLGEWQLVNIYESLDDKSKHVLKMDPKIYSEILDYKCKCIYPEGLSKQEKNIFRKKALLFRIEGERQEVMQISEWNSRNEKK